MSHVQAPCDLRLAVRLLLTCGVPVSAGCSRLWQPPCAHVRPASQPTCPPPLAHSRVRPFADMFADSRVVGSFTRRWPGGRSATHALVRARARPQPPTGIGLQAGRKALVVEEEGARLAVVGLLDALPCRQAGAGLQAGQHGRGRRAPTQWQALPVPCTRQLTLPLAPRPLAARTSPPCTLYPPCVQAVGCRM